MYITNYFTSIWKIWIMKTNLRSNNDQQYITTILEDHRTFKISIWSLAVPWEKQDSKQEVLKHL